MISASLIYTKASIARNNAIDEKYYVIGNYVNIIFNLYYKYYRNPYIGKCINSISESINEFLSEIDLEQEIYDRILDYFAELELITDCRDEVILNNCYKLIDYFDNLCYRRLSAFSDFVEYYYDLMLDFELSRMECDFGYKSPISFKEKMNLLKLLPK